MPLLLALGFPILRKLQYGSAMLRSAYFDADTYAEHFLHSAFESVFSAGYQLTKVTTAVTDGYDIQVRARSSRAVALSSAPLGALTVLEEALCLSID